ncbi:MAG TPA: hypothetical protein VJY35_11470, partial [Candidatus Eisenbacteria bacterium]|nr:hypothetical protein [Candidatus Eisenbacteria bacterium]
MSNYLYGLRQDPFSSPATLSAKEASRLIRRRVGAFGGDGGALFPIATCDEIHRVTGGLPDAILELAGRALQLAAAAGATSVSIEHVHEAQAAQPVNTGTETPAPHDDAVEDDDASTTPAGDEEVEEAQVEEEQVEEAAIEEEPTIADDDDELPPFRPASFMLPTEPNQNLNSDAQEWVARFIPSQMPRPAMSEAARGARSRTSSEPKKTKKE